jgi:thiol-disulfide isomerase/thioredoxin
MRRVDFAGIPPVIAMAAILAASCGTNEKEKARKDDDSREARPSRSAGITELRRELRDAEAALSASGPKLWSLDHRGDAPGPLPSPDRLPMPSDWAVDADKALALGKATGRPVLIDFGASWCAACQELERKTFTDEEFRAKAKRFIPVRVDLTEDEEDSPANKAARVRWNIKGLPLVLVLDSKGAEVARIEAFIEPRDLLAKMERVE